MTNAIVSLQEFETKLGRVLSLEEADQAQSALDEVASQLEDWLGRVFGPVTVTGERHKLTRGGLLTPYKWPTGEVLSYTLYGGDPVTDPNLLYSVLDTYWPAGTDITITYLAGDPASKGVKAAVTNSVKAAWLVGPEVGAGVIGSYSVEGTSVTYGPAASSAANTGGVGRMVVSDLRPLLGLRHHPMGLV